MTVARPVIDPLPELWARWGVLATTARAIVGDSDAGFGFDGTGLWRHDWGGSWCELVPAATDRAVLVGFDRADLSATTALTAQTPEWVQDAALQPGLWMRQSDAGTPDRPELFVDFIFWYDGGSWHGVQSTDTTDVAYIPGPMEDRAHSVAALLVILGMAGGNKAEQLRQLDFDLEDYVETFDMEPGNDPEDEEFADSEDLPRLRQKAERLLTAAAERRLDGPALADFLDCVIDPDIPAGLAVAQQLGLSSGA